MKKAVLRIIGHLGADATITNVNGKSVINFSVAATDKYKDKQGAIKEDTTWVACSFWANKPNLVPYLKKGTHVAIEGKPSVRTYTNKEGKVIASLECSVFDLMLVGNKRENSNDVVVPEVLPVVNEEPNEPVDDLPF